jgi:hypothetical protein
MGWLFGKILGKILGNDSEESEAAYEGDTIPVDESAFKDRKPAKLLSAGDVVYNEVLLVTQNGIFDINDFVVEINIYEDLFSPCLHGNIVIRDTQNLIERIPLVGDEILTLDINTPELAGPNAANFDPTNNIQRSFGVYAIKNRTLSNEDKEQLYTMHFMSLEGIRDNVTYLCQKFEGATDEVVQKVFDESFKDIPKYVNDVNKDNPDSAPKAEIFIGDTPHLSKVSFLPTMWTPFQIFNYLAKRSLGTENPEAPTFLFYETTKAYYFMSISGLIKSQLDNGFVQNKFKYRKRQFDEQIGPDALRAGYEHVEDFEFLTSVDVIQGQDLGHFTSSLATFDMVKKEYTPTIYDHGFDFQKYPHLGNYESTPHSVIPTKKEKKYNSIFPPNIMRSSDSKIFVENIHKGVLDNSDDELINLHPEKYVQQRNSLLSDISTLKVKVTVPGRTNMEVGQIVDLDYPSAQSGRDASSSEEVRDQWVSGYYIITAIHHQITKLRHNAICELAKDSYLNELTDITEAAPAETTATSQPTNPTNPPSTTTTPPAPTAAPTS